MKLAKKFSTKEHPRNILRQVSLGARGVASSNIPSSDVFCNPVFEEIKQFAEVFDEEKDDRESQCPPGKA